MAKTKVQISIEDENEFEPEFDQNEYIFELHSIVNKGNKIGQFTAKDGDFFDSKKLTFRAFSGKIFFKN